MSRVWGKIRVRRVTPIQHFFFFGLKVKSVPLINKFLCRFLESHVRFMHFQQPYNCLISCKQSGGQYKCHVMLDSTDQYSVHGESKLNKTCLRSRLNGN